MTQTSSIKKLLELLRVSKVEKVPKKRFGNCYDGGYVIADDLHGIGKMYSYGVNDDLSFEGNFVAQHPIPVALFDPTIREVPKPKSNFFTFHLEGLKHQAPATPGFSGWLFRCLKNQLNQRHPNRWARFFINKVKFSLAQKFHYNSLEHHLRRLGDWGRKDLFLKVDIEGDEFNVFAHADEGVLNHFQQIALEVHGLGEPNQREVQLKALENLSKNHNLIHVHYNNYGGDIPVIEGMKCPQYLELTYLRKDPQYTFSNNNSGFPEDLDFPNNINYADPALNFFPFLGEENAS